MPELRDAFWRDGAVLVGDWLSPAETSELFDVFQCLHQGEAAARQFVLSESTLAKIRSNEALRNLASELAGAQANVVRMIAFDKTPEANWFVPWHQDRTITVREKAACEGFEIWTFKEGHHHVEPPVSLLEKMVTLRVHFDDCTADNGPVEVIPGSHALSRLDRDQIAELASRVEPRPCLAKRGEILAMRPLIVHRSQRATQPGHRRILHLEFCAGELPPELSWSV